MDQYQPLGRVRIDVKFLQTFQKVFRILGFPMEKRADDKLLFVCLVPAVLAKLLLTDQKAGDTLCQKGIFAYLFRGTGDADHSQKTVFMVKRHVDALAGSCKIVRFSHFDGSTGYSGFPSDLMIGSDPGRVCAGDNGAGRVDKIDIVAADIFDRVDDLLGKGVADVCDHGILLERLTVFILRKAGFYIYAGKRNENIGFTGCFLLVSISYMFYGFNLNMLSITIK